MSSPWKAQLKIEAFGGWRCGGRCRPHVATRSIVGGKGQRKNFPVAEWRTENRPGPSVPWCPEGSLYQGGWETLTQTPTCAKWSLAVLGGAAGRPRKPRPLSRRCTGLSRQTALGQGDGEPSCPQPSPTSIAIHRTPVSTRDRRAPVEVPSMCQAHRGSWRLMAERGHCPLPSSCSKQGAGKGFLNVSGNVHLWPKEIILVAYVHLSLYFCQRKVSARYKKIIIFLLD